MNIRISARERGLIKGALRRVFARSELRRSVLAERVIRHSDPKHPRVTKWVRCETCELPTPAYKAAVDHIDPLIPVTSSLDQMSWDELLDRLWCPKENLAVICKLCHTLKTKSEQKQRVAIKKEKRLWAATQK